MRLPVAPHAIMVAVEKRGGSVVHKRTVEGDGDVRAEWTAALPGPGTKRIEVGAQLDPPHPTAGAVLSADVPHAGDFELHVHAGHAYVTQDHRIGDATFDDRFVIKTDDPDLLPIWLDEGVWRLLGAFWRPTGSIPDLTIERGQVRARLGFGKEDVARVEAALALVDAVAARPKRLAAELDEVAAALDAARRGGEWALDPASDLHLVRPGAEISIAVRRDPSSIGAKTPWLRTEVRAERRDGADLLATVCEHALHKRRRPSVDARGIRHAEIALGDYVAAATSPDVLATAVARPAIARLVEATRPAAIIFGVDALTILVPGLALDVERLRQAVELAITLAAGRRDGDGPYR